MVEQQSGQWNVATKENEVYLERVTDDGKRIYDEALDPGEARELARLLTKHADGISDSDDSGKAENTDDDNPEDSDDSAESDDSDESGKGKDSDKSED